MTIIYKILTAGEWAATESSGVLEGSEVDRRYGFIHFSAADQVRETAAKHFAGQSGLMLLHVDASRLGRDLRWEPSRGGALFPHLYAPLQIDAVVKAEPLPLDSEGRHVFPDGLKA